MEDQCADFGGEPPAPPITPEPPVTLTPPVVGGPFEAYIPIIVW